MTPEIQQKAIELSQSIQWFEKKIEELKRIDPDGFGKKNKDLECTSIELSTYPNGHEEKFNFFIYEKKDKDDNPQGQLLHLTNLLAPKIIMHVVDFKNAILAELRIALHDLKEQYKKL